MSPATVVTSLLDPAQLESSNEFLLDLDADLLCFTELSLDDALCSRRQQQGLQKRTEAVSFSAQSLATYELLTLATDLRHRRPLLNGNPLRDTPLASVLGWCKLELLERAIELNPFDTEHFIWVDFDLASAARTEHYREDGVFTRTPAGCARSRCGRWTQTWCATAPTTSPTVTITSPRG